MPQPDRRKVQKPSPLGLLMTSLVALALFTGIVVMSKALPVSSQTETTGSAASSDTVQMKAPELSAPARAP